MRYFLTISLILHLMLFLVFGSFKKTNFVLRQEIFEIGYIEGQIRNNKIKKEKLQINLNPINEEIVLEKKVEEKINDLPHENSNESIGISANTSAGTNNKILNGEAAGNRGLINPKLASWFNEIRNKIEKFKKYPEEARKQDIEGEVVIELSIQNTGYTGKINIFKSSGNKLLDTEAVRMIKATEPFIPPKEINFSEISLRVPIMFNLRKK